MSTCRQLWQATSLVAGLLLAVPAVAEEAAGRLATFEKAPGESLKRLGADYLKAIERYAKDADRAGTSFVEIQNTMLFATVGTVNEPA